MSSVNYVHCLSTSHFYGQIKYFKIETQKGFSCFVLKSSSLSSTKDNVMNRQQVKNTGFMEKTTLVTIYAYPRKCVEFAQIFLCALIIFISLIIKVFRIVSFKFKS